MVDKKKFPDNPVVDYNGKCPQCSKSMSLDTKTKVLSCPDGHYSILERDFATAWDQYLAGGIGPRELVATLKNKKRTNVKSKKLNKPA